jgi:hypothetical protein
MKPNVVLCALKQAPCARRRSEQVQAPRAASAAGKTVRALVCELHQAAAGNGAPVSAQSPSSSARLDLAGCLESLSEADGKPKAQVEFPI